MPKDLASTRKRFTRQLRPPKAKAVQVHAIPNFYLTAAQFKFITAQRREYLQHKRDPEVRLEFLQAVWGRFLEAHPDHNIPPFPEDEEMVTRFHLSRARAIGAKLDNMIDFTGGAR